MAHRVEIVGQAHVSFDRDEGERRFFVIDHQRHPSVALKISALDGVLTGVEEKIIAVEGEPDRRDVRPVVGTDRGQRGSPRPREQEPGSRLESWAHRAPGPAS